MKKFNIQSDCFEDLQSIVSYLRDRGQKTVWRGIWNGKNWTSAYIECTENQQKYIAVLHPSVKWEQIPKTSNIMENLEWKEEIKRYVLDFTPCFDAVKGDYVVFTRSIYGAYNCKKRTAEFLGTEKIHGIIINESYGKDKAQHTFTIWTINNEKIKIKGRNLYKNSTTNINCIRAKWIDENERNKIADEKHDRGTKAKKNKWSNYPTKEEFFRDENL